MVTWTTQGDGDAAAGVRPVCGAKDSESLRLRPRAGAGGISSSDPIGASQALELGDRQSRVQGRSRGAGPEPLRANRLPTLVLLVLLELQDSLLRILELNSCSYCSPKTFSAPPQPLVVSPLRPCPSLLGCVLVSRAGGGPGPYPVRVAGRPVGGPRRDAQ